MKKIFSFLVMLTILSIVNGQNSSPIGNKISACIDYYGVGSDGRSVNSDNNISWVASNLMGGGFIEITVTVTGGGQSASNTYFLNRYGNSDGKLNNDGSSSSSQIAYQITGTVNSAQIPSGHVGAIARLTYTYSVEIL